MILGRIFRHLDQLFTSQEQHDKYIYPQNRLYVGVDKNGQDYFSDPDRYHYHGDWRDLQRTKKQLYLRELTLNKRRNHLYYYEDEREITKLPEAYFGSEIPSELGPLNPSPFYYDWNTEAMDDPTDINMPEPKNPYWEIEQEYNQILQTGFIPSSMMDRTGKKLGLFWNSQYGDHTNTATAHPHELEEHPYHMYPWGEGPFGARVAQEQNKANYTYPEEPDFQSPGFHLKETKANTWWDIDYWRNEVLDLQPELNDRIIYGENVASWRERYYGETVNADTSHHNPHYHPPTHYSSPKLGTYYHTHAEPVYEPDVGPTISFLPSLSAKAEEYNNFQNPENYQANNNQQIFAPYNFQNQTNNFQNQTNNFQNQANNFQGNNLDPYNFQNQTNNFQEQNDIDEFSDSQNTRIPHPIYNEFKYTGPDSTRVPNTHFSSPPNSYFDDSRVVLKNAQSNDFVKDPLYYHELPYELDPGRRRAIDLKWKEHIDTYQAQFQDRVGNQKPHSMANYYYQADQETKQAINYKDEFLGRVKKIWEATYLLNEEKPTSLSKLSESTVKYWINGPDQESYELDKKTKKKLESSFLGKIFDRFNISENSQRIFSLALGTGNFLWARWSSGSYLLSSIFFVSWWNLRNGQDKTQGQIWGISGSTAMIALAFHKRAPIPAIIGAGSWITYVHNLIKQKNNDFREIPNQNYDSQNDIEEIEDLNNGNNFSSMNIQFNDNFNEGNYMNSGSLNTVNHNLNRPKRTYQPPFSFEGFAKGARSLENYLRDQG